MKMTDGKCYWCPARLKGYYTPTNPPSNNICPFGKGQPDGQPMRMQAVNQIAGFKASQQWMVQDYDQINAPSANAPWEALTPVHGSVRNVLFFDLHAESLPASTVLN